MANYANLLATIAANIYTNNNNEVTAAMVKAAVDQMVASLGAGYQFMGVATPATTPGNTDIKQFYIASIPGTYTNFLDAGSDPLEVAKGEVAALKYDTAWSKEVFADLSELDDIAETLYLRDGEKNYLAINSIVTANTTIFIQYPKYIKIKHVDRIRFRATTGTTYFYKVTLGTPATWTLIGSVTNAAAEYGTMKYLPCNVDLADNEYIGISGALSFKPSPNHQGYKGFNVDMNTAAVSGISDLVLGYDCDNMQSIEGRMEEISTGFNTLGYGSTAGESVTDSLTKPGHIITLAEDGSGDYTTWAEAYSACSNYPYDCLLVIKPGEYDVPVTNGVGYYITFDILGIGRPVLRSNNIDGTASIKTTFSPFNMDSTQQNVHRTTKIEGVTLVVKDVRYCVHDELGGLRQTSYTHIFKDCVFRHLSAPDSDWANPRCIGGGLGNGGLIIIENCEFRSEIETSVDYHGGFDGGASASKIIVKDCTLANNTVSCTTTTYESDKSIMVVQDCILAAAPICNAYNGRIDIDLVERNNIIV